MNKTEKFIEKAIQKHGDKYDYSIVDYINNRIKIFTNDLINPLPEGIIKEIKAWINEELSEV